MGMHQVGDYALFRFDRQEGRGCHDTRPARIAHTSQPMRSPMKNTTLVAALLAAFSAPAAFAAATTADVVVIMDESGSMSGEQTWMAGTIGLLDTGLIAN